MAEACTLAPLYLAILLSYISTSCLHGFSYKVSNPAGCTIEVYPTKCFAVGSFERVLLSTVQATKLAINAAICSTEYNRKRQYFKHRVSYYSNHVACFTMFKPLVNVHPNPGPTAREKKNSVSCLYLNARSLVRKMDEFQTLTAEIDMIVLDFNIPKMPKTKRFVYNFKKANWDALKEVLY